MPYAYTTRNRSVSAPPQHNRTSLSYSQLAPDHSARNSFGHHSQSFQCRVPYNTTIPRTSAPRAVSSMLVDKPLKSSLKYPWDYRETGRNAPPANHKRVRFKDIRDQLESVCVYSATGRPSAMFSPYSDGDSEVSSDDDYDDISSRMMRASITTAAAAAVPLEVAEVISQIPSPHSPLTRETKVRLESISFFSGRLDQGQPLLLCGTVRVLNVAYEKLVTAHYTLDGWATYSEVRAQYVDATARGAAPAAAGRYGAPANSSGTWDKFAFTISLALRAPPCTLLLAVRFAVADVGEWWDNNGGENFRIVLGPALARSGTTGAGYGMPRLPGLASGSGPSSGPGQALHRSSSVRDRSFVNAVAADFPRQPLAASCSANAQAAMAGMFPSMVPYPAPVPAAVTNRWQRVA